MKNNIINLNVSNDHYIEFYDKNGKALGRCSVNNKDIQRVLKNNKNDKKKITHLRIFTQGIFALEGQFSPYYKSKNFKIIM